MLGLNVPKTLNSMALGLCLYEKAQKGWHRKNQHITSRERDRRLKEYEKDIMWGYDNCVSFGYLNKYLFYNIHCWYIFLAVIQQKYV